MTTNREKWLKIKCTNIEEVKSYIHYLEPKLEINLNGVDYKEVFEFLFDKDGYGVLFPLMTNDMAYDLVNEYTEEFREALVLVDAFNSRNNNKTKEIK